MKTAEFKKYTADLRNVLRNITENMFFTELEFYDEIPSSAGQYWEYELSLLDENFEKEIIRSVGFFSGNGVLKNPNLSINDFFLNNDRIVKEFYTIDEYDGFNNLIPLLKNYDEYERIGYSVSLNINAFIVGGDEWLRQVCEEYMLIIHLDGKDNDTLYLGVQQNERYKLRIEELNQISYIVLPFDKCRYFSKYHRVEGYNDKRYYQYEVALSFAGEDREYVYEIADQLKKLNVRVFYDIYETVSLWGKDLYSHLDDVYRNKSRYCVMFLSKFYREKVWTNHERESAQARAFMEREEYILPIRLDGTEIPGIRPTTGYIDGTKYTSREIAEFIKKKVREN